MSTISTQVNAWCIDERLVRFIRYLAFPVETITIELYSSNGRTYTLKARTSVSISRDKKLRKESVAFRSS